MCEIQANRQNLALHQEDTSLQIGSTAIAPVPSVRNLGVCMESEMSMRVHVGKVAKACFHHLRRGEPIIFHSDTTYDEASRFRLHSVAVRLLQHRVG